MKAWSSAGERAFFYCHCCSFTFSVHSLLFPDFWLFSIQQSRHSWRYWYNPVSSRICLFLIMPFCFFFLCLWGSGSLSFSSGLTNPQQTHSYHLDSSVIYDIPKTSIVFYALLLTYIIMQYVCELSSHLLTQQFPLTNHLNSSVSPVKVYVLLMLEAWFHVNGCLHIVNINVVCLS